MISGEPLVFFTFLEEVVRCFMLGRLHLIELLELYTYGAARVSLNAIYPSFYMHLKINYTALQLTFWHFQHFPFVMCPVKKQDILVSQPWCRNSIPLCCLDEKQAGWGLGYCYKLGYTMLLCLIHVVFQILIIICLTCFVFFVGERIKWDFPKGHGQSYQQNCDDCRTD